MPQIEPVPGERAALAELSEGRVLIIADYHAGIETALRYEGLEIESRADDRRNRVLDLLERTGADRLVILGDLAHWIGEPAGVELDEITAFLDAVTEEASVVLVKGNHDGRIEDKVAITVSDAAGMTIGDVGFVHGHTIPAREVLESAVVCIGHEHATVRLEDEVGGSRIEPAWLRGSLDPEGFPGHDSTTGFDGELVVFPAFNRLVGGTWVNRDGRDFLSPILPDGLRRGELYLLDGTRLGDYLAV